MPPEPEPPKNLIKRRDELSRSLDERKKRRNYFGSIGLGFFAAGIVSFFILPHNLRIDVIPAMIIGSIGGMSLAISQRPEFIRNELARLDDEIDFVSISTQSYEQKAQKLLRIQQNELTRYYGLIFQQGKGIFWTGVVSLFLGFVLIAGVVIYIGYDMQNPSAGNIDLYEKLVVGVVGAVGAILTNYIGVIYLKMFSEIVQSVNKSVEALNVSNSLYFSNVLASTIQETTLREKTLESLALGQRSGQSG